MTRERIYEGLPRSSARGFVANDGRHTSVTTASTSTSAILGRKNEAARAYNSNWHFASTGRIPTSIPSRSLAHGSVGRLSLRTIRGASKQLSKEIMARPKSAPHGQKSQAIREFLGENKKTKASEVVAALAEKGINVSTQMVYKLKARKTMGKRRRKAESNGQVVGLSISNLIAAKKLVDTVGGVDQAREAINALAKLS